MARGEDSDEDGKHDGKKKSGGDSAGESDDEEEDEERRKARKKRDLYLGFNELEIKKFVKSFRKFASPLDR